MHPVFETGAAASATPITFVTKSSLGGIVEQLSAASRQYIEAAAFKAKPGQCLLLPSAKGGIEAVLFGIEDHSAKWRDPFRPGQLPGLLPPGVYRFANAPHDARLAALAFALGSYRFSRYRKADAVDVKLQLSNELDSEDISRMAEAAALARDLINVPANDMGPE
jgi:leucyl aminopeptidase